jgi:hypothetical protein
LGPKHVARKHVYNYFIRILISFDELCYMKDCVIKKVIEKCVTGCRDTILLLDFVHCPDFYKQKTLCSICDRLCGLVVRI